MRAVDTNLLVRLITGDDETQTAQAERFVAQGAWVPVVALAETVWVLKQVYGLSAAVIADAIEMLLGHEQLVLQDADCVEIALAHFRDRPELSFTDCLILESARKAGHLPMGTFDRRLGRAPGAHKLG